MAASVSDISVDELDLASQSWMSATVIEDDDLMFGGKPLCTWYEEDRQRISTSLDEEETRGRQRERVRVDSQHHHHHHHQNHPKPQHHHQQHHRHHSSKSAEPKV